jgi:hypothetical protein
MDINYYFLIHYIFNIQFEIDIVLSFIKNMAFQECDYELQRIQLQG